jgi:hypothetical protein
VLETEEIVMELVPGTARAGGWTQVARALSTPAQVVSRQRVYAWWVRRARNGFPEGTPTGSHGGREFNFAEVADWYARYRPSVGGRPRKAA